MTSQLGDMSLREQKNYREQRKANNMFRSFGK